MVGFLLTKESYIALLYTSLSLLLLPFIPSIAFAQEEFAISPHRVVFNNVSTVAPAGGELETVLQVRTWGGRSEYASEVVHVALGSPLLDVDSGEVLDAERIAIGVNTYENLEPGSILQFKLNGASSLSLHLLIHVKRFASPGTYRGSLYIGPASALEQMIEIPLTVEVLPWVEVNISAAVEIASAQNLVPGPDSYITPEPQVVAFVSSNTSWVLLGKTATAALELTERRNGFMDWEQYQIGIQQTDWFTPAEEQLMSIGKQSRVLGHGTATGSFGSGLVPLALESRLLFNREQPAGLYQGWMELQVIPSKTISSTGL
jgi:hypothetical protein